MNTIPEQYLVDADTLFAYLLLTGQEARSQSNPSVEPAWDSLLYFAQDSNGLWYAFQYEPKHDGYIWLRRNPSNNCRRLAHTRLIDNHATRVWKRDIIK